METDIIILILHIIMLLFSMFSLVCVVTFLARKEQNLLAVADGRNFCLQGSFPQGRAKYRGCVGVFVSRLHKDTRVRHVERHVKCEPIPTKYGTYASYCIRCSTENTKQLLDSEMWPCNVIVKQYFKVIN